MTIEIHCSFHGATEVIQLPDGYYDFEGEIKCLWGSNDGWYLANPGIMFFMLGHGSFFPPLQGAPLTD